MTLCKKCGREKPDDGLRQCARCRESQSRSQKARIAYLRARGVCRICGHEKAIDGKTLCPECVQRQRQYNRTYLERQRTGEKHMGMSDRNPPSEVERVIADRVRKARLDGGLSVERAAELAEISDSAVDAYEILGRGTRMVAYMRMLVRETGADAAWLMAADVEESA